MNPSVVLVGPPGAGKSSVGRVLARELGVAFRDTDDDIEKTTGLTISEIFIDQGEDAFRSLETTAVSRALTSHDGVLSLGGGAIIRTRVRELLTPHTVVFLDVGLAAAVKRVGMNANRPLLLGNVRSTLKALMDARRPLYVEVATHMVQTDAVEVDEVARQVLEKIGQTR